MSCMLRLRGGSGGGDVPTQRENTARVRLPGQATADRWTGADIHRPQLGLTPRRKTRDTDLNWGGDRTHVKIP